MLRKKRRRLDNEVNAGSMADIAFLLLIFFLVTTTILVDKGIMVKLPPFSAEPAPPVSQERVYTVKVNGENQLLVEDKRMDVALLRNATKKFITNYLSQSEQIGRTKKPLVSLQNDRGTSYETYLSVYNELKGAYNELWEEKSQQLFGKSFGDIALQQQKIIRTEIPLIISEADPTAHNEE